MEKILTSIISEDYARKNCVFPLELTDKKLTVLMKKFDINIVNTLRSYSNREIYVIEKSEKEILKNIEENYFEVKYDGNENEVLFNDILDNALIKKASDIHFEPFATEVRIRFRVNGDLITENRISLKDYMGLSTIIKLKSMCDITEKRVPQDGRFSYISNSEEVDIRVSTIPTVYGEKIVMRLLNHKDFLKSRKELGFSGNANKKINQILNENSGMLIVSGNTGSGKSSTVYSLLNELKERKINITTIEDPVEYKIDGINQIQVNLKAGIGFDNGLRAILRQDPDCIVLGEIRDIDSAKIAVRAAITGHFVIATLHTNDAISSITRLRDMGIETFMINAALVGVISQKLVKKKLILNQCSSEERTLIYEILVIDEDIKKAIKDNKQEHEIREIALKNGMITYEDSIKEKTI